MNILSIAKVAISQSQIFGKNSLHMIPSRRVPVLRYKDKETDLQVDLIANQYMGIINSSLVNMYARYDQRFHILGFYLKSWAKQVGIQGGPRGYLTSYALNLMLIAYLQSVVEPPVLPNLQKKGPKGKLILTEYPFVDMTGESIIRLVETDVYYNKDLLDIYRGSGKKLNLDTLAELMTGFFNFYAWDFMVFIYIYGE